MGGGRTGGREGALGCPRPVGPCVRACKAELAAAQGLLKKKANVNAVNNKGKTPLDLVVKGQSPALIPLLKRFGALQKATSEEESAKRSVSPPHPLPAPGRGMPCPGLRGTVRPQTNSPFIRFTSICAGRKCVGPALGFVPPRVPGRFTMGATGVGGVGSH